MASGFGPFVVDRAGYRVLRDGRPLDLTPKLLDLLLHLLDHAGTLVTKEALLDALWPDANVTDNALAQAVSELRQALGDDAGDPRFIKTVARRGYRFIAPVEPIEPVAARSPAATDPAAPAETRRTIDRRARFHQRHRRRRIGVAVGRHRRDGDRRSARARPASASSIAGA